jgi:hypothetical protein
VSKVLRAASTGSWSARSASDTTSRTSDVP